MTPNVDAAIKKAKLIAGDCHPFARYDKYRMPVNEAARIERGMEYIIYVLTGEILSMTGE